MMPGARNRETESGTAPEMDGSRPTQVGEKMREGGGLVLMGRLDWGVDI